MVERGEEAKAHLKAKIGSYKGGPPKYKAAVRKDEPITEFNSGEPR
jgi:hypothetical protein